MYSPSLLATINCSIGNKKNHISIQDLCELFNGKKVFNELDKYIIDIIQKEATKEELNTFKKNYKITTKQLKYILSINPY